MPTRLGNATVVQMMPNVSRAPGAVDIASVEVREYVGEALFILDAALMASGSAAYFVHESDDNVTFSLVTGGTFDVVTSANVHQVLKLNTDSLKRYVKIVGTILTTNNAACVEFVGNKKAR